MRTLLMSLLLSITGVAFAQTVDDGTAAWTALRNGGIALIRHATAPGTGDPAGFALGRCETQRNLDAVGRAEAVRIGAAFRAQGVAVGRVLASQWCRTRETADLAFPSRVSAEPIFNSFYDNAANDPRQTAAASTLLRAWKGPGAMVVVTHQVNITALTGVFPASGEVIVVVPDGDRLKLVGRIAATR